MRRNAHRHSRAIRATLVRLVPLACALFVLCTASGARAAAPMCDPQAQSIAAPAPLFPIKSATLTHSRCKSELLGYFDTGPRGPERLPELKLDLGQRVWPSLLRWIISAPLTQTLAIEASTVELPSGVTSGVFRPPRSRASI